MEANPCLLLQRLHRMVQAVTSIGLLGHSVYTVHVLMRDEKEWKKIQARSNKQQGKATQHTHM